MRRAEEPGGGAVPRPTGETAETAADVAASFAATLVDEWARHGVRHAVVAPGSRSTPLALAVARHGAITTHVSIDERAAGFFALGLALGSGRPAVVVTTSGTAAAELHAAVVEAHHASVPLLVCTADRPPEAHGVGAPQTIDQLDLFGSVLRRLEAPGVPDRTTEATWRSIAARAVVEAAGASGRPGPVQLNLAFREPLVGSPGELPSGRAGGKPLHRLVRAAPAAPGPSDLAELAALCDGRRGVVVAGAGCGGPAAVHRLAAKLGWPVLADPLSASRVPAPTTVAAFDALLREPEFAEAVRPEAVLRLGAPPASRVLSEFLAASGADQVLVDPTGTFKDPERRASLLVHADPAATLRALARMKLGAAPCSYSRLWREAEASAQRAIDEVLARRREPTGPGVARALVRRARAGTTIVASSSMPIRELEWYAPPRRGVQVVANRGANGIDGVVSTVLGVAAARHPRPVVGLVGDVAAVHDLGGLLAAPQGARFGTIVVLDDRGGGIFEFLAQARLPRPTFEALFVTPPRVALDAVATAAGIPTSIVETAARFPGALRNAQAAPGMRLVVVRTERPANVELHRELEDALRAAARSALRGARSRATRARA